VKEFSFEDFMMKALLHERAEERRRLSGCPQSIDNHQVDRLGKCVFCGRQVSRGSSRPFPDPAKIKSDLDLAYEYYYSPDYGNSNLDRY